MCEQGRPLLALEGTMLCNCFLLPCNESKRCPPLNTRPKPHSSSMSKKRGTDLISNLQTFQSSSTLHTEWRLNWASNLTAQRVELSVRWWIDCTHSHGYAVHEPTADTQRRTRMEAFLQNSSFHLVWMVISHWIEEILPQRAFLSPEPHIGTEKLPPKGVRALRRARQRAADAMWLQTLLETISI